MATRTISTKLAIDGEAGYKKSIENIMLTEKYPTICGIYRHYDVSEKICPVPLSKVDEKGKYRFMSQTARSLFGWTDLAGWDRFYGLACYGFFVL